MLYSHCYDSTGHVSSCYITVLAYYYPSAQVSPSPYFGQGSKIFTPLSPLVSANWCFPHCLFTRFVSVEMLKFFNLCMPIDHVLKV